jgi:hypothetical protein
MSTDNTPAGHRVRIHRRVGFPAYISLREVALLSADEARELAVVLIEAADKLDQGT